MDEVVRLDRRCVSAHIPAGAPLFAAVDAICARHEVSQGEVRFRGRVRDARVVLDEEAGWSLVGPLRLISAEASIGVSGLGGVSAVLAWADNGLPRMIAGVLEEAISEGVEVIVELWNEPATTTRETRPPQPRPAPAPAPVRESRPAPVPAAAPRPVPPRADATPVRRPAAEVAERRVEAPPPPPPPAPAPAPKPAEVQSGWAAAVAASQGPAPAANAPKPAAPKPTGLEAFLEGTDDDDLRAGDVLVHPTFGRCKVMRGSDGERVKVRRPNGHLAELALGVLKLTRLPDEDDARVFKVQIGRR